MHFTPQRTEVLGCPIIILLNCTTAHAICKLFNKYGWIGGHMRGVATKYADVVAIYQDDKVHGANIGPTWVLSAPWTLLLGKLTQIHPMSVWFCFGYNISFWWIPEMCLPIFVRAPHRRPRMQQSDAIIRLSSAADLWWRKKKWPANKREGRNATCGSHVQLLI